MIYRLLLTLLLTALPLCAAPRLSYEQRVEIQERNLQRFLHAVSQAASAAFEVTYVRGRPIDGRETTSISLPADEFKQLKQSLSRTRSVPPARTITSSRITPIYGVELCLRDAQGNCLASYSLRCLFMKQSTAEALSPDRVGDEMKEPSWYLPDADYEAFRNLPSLKKAYQEAEKQFRSRS
ncbi:MAG: hypothetical protein J1E42_07835 [Akkermansiaceae bacterium]|nr:hypothetical protein [Akkermansiaceae bacterium]